MKPCAPEAELPEPLRELIRILAMVAVDELEATAETYRTEPKEADDAHD